LVGDGDDGADVQAGVQALGDEVHGAQQVGHAVQLHRADADGHDDLVGGDQGADGEQAQGGRAVEQHQVDGPDALQVLPQKPVHG